MHAGVHEGRACGHSMLSCCWCGAELLAFTPAELDDGPAPPEFFAWVDEEIARMEAGGDPPEGFAGTREECIVSMRAEREARARSSTKHTHH